MKRRHPKRAFGTSALVTGLSILLSAVIFGPHAYAQAQASTGQIVGTVYDESGAVVPDVTVSATNKVIGLTSEVKTNQAGEYRLVLLPPGRYTVVFKHRNFKSYQAEDVVVDVGAAVTLNATMTVGTVAETVEVTSASPLVNTTRQEAGALINLQSITNLPINGRRFQDFISATPTVQVEPQRGQLSFAGQRGINSNISIDGADYNEPFFGGIRGGERSNNAFTIPQESIAQFQVVPYGYAPEFGRSTSGLVNAVTKSGTNDLHGSGFYYLRHKGLGKSDVLNRKELDSLHQFGFSMGGPIRRGETFFFVAGEDQIQDNPRVVIFRQLARGILTAANDEAFNFYKSLETRFISTNNAITGLARIDHQITGNHRLSLRYNYSKNNALNATSVGGPFTTETTFALSSNGTEGDRVNNLAAQWTGILSPHAVNELRFQYSRENRPRNANALLAGVSNLIGTFGTRNFLPTFAYDYRFQVAENFTWNYGRHSFKFGGEWNHDFIFQFFKFNQFGVFSVSGSDVTTLLNIMSVGSGGPGDPANRFDSPAVTYRVNIGNGLLRSTLNQLAFFGQDSWRITPRFTVNFGLRWEGYFNPQPDTSNAALTNAVKNSTFPFGKVDPTRIPDNANQLMPRLGIAWDPSGAGKTVIRANAGLYYAHTPLLLMASPLNNFRTPAGDLSVQLPLLGSKTCTTVYCQMNAIGIDLNKFPVSNLPTLKPQDIQSIASTLGLTFDPNQGVGPLAWSPNYESPRSWQWSMGAEREVSPGWTVGADFAYINTVHLERDRDMNVPLPVVPASDLSQRPCFGLRGGTPCSPRQRPLATLDAVTIRESSARAYYRALTIRSAFRRPRYQFQVYYTLSKNTSDDDNERTAGGVFYENGFDLIPEYSFSSLDVRHLLAANTVVQLPAGFTVGAFLKFRSSRPFDPLTGADTNGDFGGPDRPYQAPGGPFKRNSFRDFEFSDIGLRVGLDLFKAAGGLGLKKIPEGKKLDFTFDLFNLLDFANISIGDPSKVYGLGIDPKTGNVLPPECSVARCFRRTRLPDGSVDGNNLIFPPFQAQVGIRFEF